MAQSCPLLRKHLDAYKPIPVGLFVTYETSAMGLMGSLSKGFFQRARLCRYNSLFLSFGGSNETA